MGWLEHLRGTVTEETFARQLMERLRQAGDTRSAHYDEANFRLCFRQPNADTGYAQLRNLYDEYLTFPTHDRERFFQFATRSLLSAHKALPDEFADARSDILLTVRQRAYFSLLELNTWIESDGTFAWPYQPLGQHLGVGLVYDLPEAMMMLQGAHLENWGVTFYEAFEQALNNLMEIDATFTTIDDHSYASATGDHYDLSRLLLPEVIRELEVLGDPVAMLPNRDRLLITGSQDRHGLETVALLAQQLLSHPRPVSGLAFRLRNDEWNAWLPDRDHPAYSLLKTLRLQSRQQDYTAQRPALQGWLSASDPPVRVAEFRVHGAGARQPPTSFCVWREGQTLLLPKTDRICFLRYDQLEDHPLVEGVNINWARVHRLVGDLIHEEESYYPPRYRVERFPTSAQLARLAGGESA